MYTYAKDAEKDKCEVSIMSNDKDLAQAASKLIYIHNNAKDPTFRMSPEDVKARWGVKPVQMIDFLALVGDAADGIPGVPGIGKVKAANLLVKYENLEKILDHARVGSLNVHGIGPKLLLMLREHGDRAMEMRKLVKLQRMEKGKKNWQKDFSVRDEEVWKERAKDFCRKENLHHLQRELEESEGKTGRSGGSSRHCK